MILFIHVLLFPKKGNLKISKNYRGITLTALTVKVYNAVLLKLYPIWNWENSLEKSECVSEKLIHNINNSDYLINHWRSMSKKSQATLLFIDFFKMFNSIYKGKMGQLLLASDLPKETVIAIMMLYKNMTVVHSPDSNTNFFDIVAGILQRDTLAPYMFIICLNLCTLNTNRSNERKWFHTKKKQEAGILQKLW